VLTSRTQHFRDDGQIPKALLSGRTGRDAGRVLALEDFSDTQILDFLTRLHNGDARRARSRFGRLDQPRLPAPRWGSP
jgi:hypothetical protein